MERALKQKNSGFIKSPLHAICPYFAMFPANFVREQVNRYTGEKDLVFDPFCGRGTTILESLLSGRQAAGSDINPVAVCASRAKARWPALDAVISRIEFLENKYRLHRQDPMEAVRQLLPSFFKRAFYFSTLRELLFLRSKLSWENNDVDCFIAALVIGSLHGEMDRSDAYFSNQMPRTICLKPTYSLRYWRERNLFPKKRDVFGMLKKKAEYRLKDLPEIDQGVVKQSDARKAGEVFEDLNYKVSLIVTSPPYLNVTSYEEDQWLRLWFLGGDPQPTYGKVSKDDRHNVENKYWQFLKESWIGVAPLMKSSSRIVVRLGALGITADQMTVGLRTSLTGVFPRARLVKKPVRSEIVRRQARNFAPKSKGCLFEMDYVFSV